MGRSKYWQALSAASLVMATSSCEDRAPRRAPQEDSASIVRRVKNALSPLPAEPPPPSDSAAPEGAKDARAVFLRAQALLDAHDFVGLVATIRMATRKRWTTDLVVALALESVDDGSDPDLGRRRVKAEARGLLESFGATAQVKRGDLDVHVLEAELLDRVRDPDGLLAAMLAFADSHQCGLDPLCALGPSGIDGIVRPEETRSERPGASPSLPKTLFGDAGVPIIAPPAPERKVSVAAGGIVRLFDRVRVPHKLGEVSFEGESGVGMTEAPEFLPIRFYTSNGVTWLDES